MPIQEGKYVTPAWQNGGPPAIDAAELTAIGNSIVQNQTDIESLQTDNTQNQSNIEQLLGWKTSAETLLSGALQTSGGTMTGNLILNADPAQNMQAATKQYVDSTFGWTLLQADSISISGSESITKNTPNLLTSFSTACAEVRILFALNISLENSTSTYVTVKFGDGVNRFIAVQYTADGVKNLNFSNSPLTYYLTKGAYVNQSDVTDTLSYTVNTINPTTSSSGYKNNLNIYFGSTYRVTVTRATANGNIYFYGR